MDNTHKKPVIYATFVEDHLSGKSVEEMREIFPKKTRYSDKKRKLLDDADREASFMMAHNCGVPMDVLTELANIMPQKEET